MSDGRDSRDGQESPAATRAVLERARSRVPIDTLRRYVGPVDPGFGEYLEAMEALVLGGESVLVRSRYVSGDLDFDEPISCAQWDRVSSYEDASGFRWYRLMASAAALLLEDRMCEGNENYFLASICSDSWALHHAGDSDAPVDLAAAVCREAKARFPWDRVPIFGVLGELVMATADGRSDADVEALCREFTDLEQVYCVEGEYVSDEYVWGLTPFDQLHAVWVELVTAYFPQRPARAVELREGLIEHGARWARR